MFLSERCCRGFALLPCIVASLNWNVPITHLVDTVGSYTNWYKVVSFSPDGSSVVSGDYNGNLNLWAVGGHPAIRGLRTVGNIGAWITSVDYSPNGSTVVSGDDKGNLTLWALEGHPPTRRVGNSGFRINAVSFSPDGIRVVSGDQHGSLKLWAVGNDPSAWGLLKVVGMNCSTIRSVDFSPDNSRVASGHDNGNLILWAVGGDPSSWGPIKTLGHVGSPIQAVRFSPDGFMVVSGHYNGNLNLWAVGGDPSTWGLLQAVGNSGSRIWALDFSLDGTRVVSGANNNHLNLWGVGPDQTTWVLLKTFGGSDTTSSDITCGVSFSPDGSWVVSGHDNGHLKLWALGGDLATWALVKKVGRDNATIMSVDFSPDGARVVAGNYVGTLTMWEVGGDCSTWGFLQPIGSSSPIWSVSFFPNGSRVVSAGGVDVWSVGGDRSSWGFLKTFNSPFVTSVDFAPDGTRVVSANESHLAWWAVEGDPSTWGLQRILSCQACSTARFSPDGSKVVCGAFGAVYLWAVEGDPSAWASLGPAGYTDSNVRSVDFSPDGSVVASGDENGNLILWAVSGKPSTWGLLTTLGNTGTGSIILSVHFLPEGSRILSGDSSGQLNLWAVGGSQNLWGLLRTLGNCSGIWSVDVSPDGSKVLSGDEEGNLNVWNASGSSFSSIPSSAYLVVVNQYPATFQEFTQMATCGSEMYAGSSYEVCNMTISQPSSSYLKRTSVHEVEELLSYYLPALRLNFTAADMSDLLVANLPTSWRTISLVLQNTRLPSSATDLFSFLNSSSPFVEELDISGTLVAGPIAARPPVLRKLRSSNALITNVSADFFVNSMELLDIRNTPYLQSTDAGALNSEKLVFRHGFPACSEPFPGHVVDGTLCKICQQPSWRFDGRPSSQKCVPCPSQRAVGELKLAGAVLIGLGLLLALLAYVHRARIKQMRDYMKERRGKVHFLEKKVKLTVFAYQQLSQLGYLANPLPPKTQALASAADAFNLAWFSTSGLSACVLGKGYYSAWLLCLVEVGLLLVAFILVGRAFGVSPLQSFSFAHGITIMTVARKTLPLFDCDYRLVTSSLPFTATIRKPLLKVDYNIDCSSGEHSVFQHLGILVLVLYCFLIPLLQVLRLFRARFVINPSTSGQLSAHLAPEGYLTVAREELRRLDPAELYPCAALGQVRVVEVATIRLRERLLSDQGQFKQEAQMVADYVPSMWWWYPLPTLSRVLLAGIYVCPPQDQAFLGCALCVTLGCGVTYFRPYLQQTDNQHDMLCQVSVGLAFALTSVQPETPLWLTLAVGTLLLLPGINFLYHLLQHFNPAHRRRRQLEELATELATSTTPQQTGIQLPVSYTLQERTALGGSNP